MESGYLVLETGEIYEGRWRGGKPRAGEVVFNTSHFGYEEMATDPSYFSQILVLTAPMQGNYGAHVGYRESKAISIQGFISLEIQDSTQNHSWLSELNQNGIPVLTDLDTRSLVLRLRDKGTPWGAIVKAKNVNEAKSLAADLISEKKKIDKDWVYAVSVQKPEFRIGKNPNGPRIAVLDYGYKENIIRELAKGSKELAIFPSRTRPQEVQKWEPQGILLSNGPGDPSDVIQSVQTIRELLGWRPIFGICMGHQILAKALGLSTYKLRFGHRGGNHPVKDLNTGEIYVTSQNHGYAVNTTALDMEIKESHVNLNDRTNEGIECRAKKCRSVQFHPESNPGPQDAVGLFKQFFEWIR